MLTSAACSRLCSRGWSPSSLMRWGTACAVCRQAAPTGLIQAGIMLIHECQINPTSGMSMTHEGDTDMTLLSCSPAWGTSPMKGQLAA